MASVTDTVLAGDAAAASDALTPEHYTRVLARETYRAFACRAGSAAELWRWQRAFRPRLREALGLHLIAERGAADPRPRQRGEHDSGDHVREEWVIQTEPGFDLPFFVLRPLGAGGPRPLVLTPHGHGKAGKDTYVGLAHDDQERRELEQGERDIALQAVRQGYVAIAPDMRGFAGLRSQADIDADQTSSCTALHKYASLFGRTLVGERVWDIARLIDYASTRPDVDSQRIVITGNSGGGTVSLFAAACDERIGVCVPSCYFCTFERSIGSVFHCACNFVPGILRLGEMDDVAGLIAPRPFLAVAGRDDTLFPLDGVRTAYERLRAIYRTAGVEDRCRLFVGDGGHRYYQQPVWPFVRDAVDATPAA